MAFPTQVFVAVLCISVGVAHVEGTRGFHVDGTAIMAPNGQNFVMRGVSVPHSWFKNDIETVIPAVADTGANVVRVVLSDGGQYYRDDTDSVKKILDLCKQHKLVAMLEVHDTTGATDLGSLERAAEYWMTLLPVLQDTEDRVIVNIANEWGQYDSWADGYKRVIPALRQKGLKNMLAVDASGWGQDVSSIADKGKEVFESDPDRNTIFGLHMYEVVAPNEAVAKESFDRLASAGVPYFVGEFSYGQNGKDVAYKYIMEHCKNSNISWIVWSWYGNNDPKMDLVKGPDGRQQTSFGQEVIEGWTGIRQTSSKLGIW